ncbi:MAG: serine protease [Bacilli bacterium]|nr:serine protease [Bacilli bacterium]
MPTWDEIAKEIESAPTVLPDGQMVYAYDEVLQKYLRMFAEYRNRNVILYYSDWLNPMKGANVDINDSDMTGFMTTVYGLDRDKGLDLILHTPGGSPQATEGIVEYLHSMFGNDIEVFVPHMAMSAGTMLACATKKIWMGKQSCLGPIDPQFASVSAFNIKKEFEEAKRDLAKRPSTFRNWQIILHKYPFAFYYTVQDSIELSSKLVENWLTKYMFSEHADAENAAKTITAKLNVNTGSHAKHLLFGECEKMGLAVDRIESDQSLQDLVLSVHHACSIMGARTPAAKVIANHKGKSYIINNIYNRRAS